MKIDTPCRNVLKALAKFGFDENGIGGNNHYKLVHSDGRIIILPHHRLIKGSTLGRVIREAGIDKKKFWDMI